MSGRRPSPTSHRAMPRIAAALVAALALALAGCGPADPRAKVLEQRARWNVVLLDWVQNPDGSFHLATRVSGPPNSTIERLTVRLEMIDGTGRAVRRVWHTYDLSRAPRGGPADITVNVPPGEGTVEGIAIDRVLDPGPQDLPHLPELADAG